MKRWLLISALVLFVAGAYYYTSQRTNFRAVIPGEMYGSAQLDGTTLEKLIRENDIRTVISLRRAAPDEAWYRDEMRAITDLGVEHHSVGMYASSPHVDEIIELHELVRSVPRPFLVHCRAGIDRTGLASVLGMLADGRYTPDDVQDRINRGLDSLRSDTISKNFLSAYRAWLSAGGRFHAPEMLEQWLKSDYVDPTGNIHFLVHPINGRNWYKPFGRFAEGERFELSRARSTSLTLDGWAFDARAGTVLAGLKVLLDGVPVERVEYGIHSPWLIDDFGNENILDSGWVAKHPLHLVGDGCHTLTFTFERLDGSRWTSPPAGRICVE